MATDNRNCHCKLPFLSYTAGSPCLAGFCGLGNLQRRPVLLRRRLRDPQRWIQAGGGGGFGRGGLRRGGDVARQAARVKPAAFLTSSVQLTIFFFVGTRRKTHFPYVFLFSCLEKTVTFCRNENDDKKNILRTFSRFHPMGIVSTTVSPLPPFHSCCLPTTSSSIPTPF